MVDGPGALSTVVVVEEVPPSCNSHRLNNRTTMPPPSPLQLRSFSNRAFIRKVRKAVTQSGAPKSIAAIEDETEDSMFPSPDACAFIRQLGCMRRVFLLNPYFTADQLEGMAYRVRTLTKNEGLSSVLIATDHRLENEGAISSMMYDRTDECFYNESGVDEGFPPAPGQTFHVSGGYDPLDLYQSNRHTNPAHVDRLLSSLTDLAAACRGDAKKTKIPTICIPHGAVTDGGYAWLHSSYVLSTRESAFRILNPSRGLSLDPVGLSYYLPRLGQEFQQPAARYPGCGFILALMGYEADHGDMLETGLVTHSMETTNGLGLFESMLAELPPWDQQGLLKNPTRYHGQDPPTVDHNAFFRNYVVADAVDTVTSASADGSPGMFASNNLDDDVLAMTDPSLDPDPTPYSVDRQSLLVDYAATFDSLFRSHTSVAGLCEGFREIAARPNPGNDPLEQEGLDVAADFVRRLERQSPLAVTVTHELLKRGLGPNENWRTCANRERKVQAQLLALPDYQNWARYTQQYGSGGDVEPFTDWKDESLAKVDLQEVLAIVDAAEDKKVEEKGQPPAAPSTPTPTPTTLV